MRCLRSGDTADFRQPWSDDGAKTNEAILSYNRDKCVCVAVELDGEFVTAETADEIAAALTWE